ncbi:MAG: cytochrome c biogenesis CcdA family protein [Brevinematia bacterium]
MEVGIMVAFFAGILSFLSPCILPLILPYISLISGISLSSIKSGEIGKKERLKVILSTIYFILGFTLIFIIFGIIAGQIGGILITIKDILARVAGVIIIIFGLHLLGILKIPFLDYEKRVGNFSYNKTSFITAFVMGLLFAFGWTPCIGPILGTIVGIAFYSGNATQGAILLSIYSLGLALPFLIVAVFIDHSINLISRFRKTTKFIEVTSGVILIFIGVALATNTLGIISGWISDLFPFLVKLG